MAIYFAVVFGFYFILLMTLLFGWRKVVTHKSPSASTNVFISVVIAMRNEKENLAKIIQSLADQNYSSSNFEIIIVDDHSTDGSMEEAKKWAGQLSSLNIFSLGENQAGKKEALKYGIRKSKGDVIATTDADCVLSPHWLQTINEKFQDVTVNMLIGAVALHEEKKFFSHLQSIEFASVIGTSIALCALGKPTMCNGANLSFRKKIFEEVKGYEGNEHILSGDDEFLMRKIHAKYPSSIQTLNPLECYVVTKPQADVISFFQQRIRWASKWKVNSSLFARLLAVFMFGLQAFWLALIAWALMYKLTMAVVIIFLKLTVDFFFLSSVCRTLKMRFHFLAFIGLQFLYPLYVLCVGIFSQVKDYQWKGRVATVSSR